MIINFRNFILLAGSVIMVSCATNIHKKAGHPDALIDLSDQSAYEFRGKMSFSDGTEGGSGHVHWQKSTQEIQVVLKAPLSKKSWTLTETSHQASIKTSNGQRFISTSAADLLSNQIGWQVPWEALQSWVIGQPNQSGTLEWHDDHKGYTVTDQGWVIQYSKLENYEKGVLPHKVIARKNPYSIKLSIKSWQW